MYEEWGSPATKYGFSCGILKVELEKNKCLIENCGKVVDPSKTSVFRNKCRNRIERENLKENDCWLSSFRDSCHQTVVILMNITCGPFLVP